MDEAISMTGGGLKCDNPKCDFVDMSIEIKDYDKWINAPCPKCGCNLLTQADYDAVAQLQAAVKMIQKLYGDSEASATDTDKATITARFDGTGKVNLELEK